VKMADDLSALSTDVRKRLDQLVEVLRARLATKLVALVVHGSAVRGGWHDGTSDVDLVLVIDDDSPDVLTSIGPALELARYAARIETMILTKAEIARSADCFPLLYGDLARTSIVLVGDNPFTSLVIEAHHKRLRIEQELRELRIRLRRVITDFAGKPNFGGAVDRKIKQLRGPLWALLELRGDKVDDQLDAVLAGAAAIYKVDVAPLRRAREDAKAACTALATLLDAALADVDARETP
jgi:predicted nucleotidyltransferase